MPPKNADVKVRIPQAMKDTVKRVAEARYTTESELFREAMLAYLKARGEVIQETAEVPDHPPAQPVNYRKPLKRDTQRKILDSVKKRKGKVPPPSPQK